MAIGVSMTLFSCDKSASDNTDDSRQPGNNPVIETIMTRKSVRDYTSQKISPDTIEILLRAAMAAPTAVNNQPWKYVVVTNENKIQEMADSTTHAKMLAKAPLAILVCGDETKFFEGEGREFWVQDCSASTENLLLAAHALGLGAVWTAVYPNMTEVRMYQSILGLESTVIPLCVVPIGYPAEDPQVKDKWKPEKVTYIK